MSNQKQLDKGATIERYICLDKGETRKLCICR